MSYLVSLPLRGGYIHTKGEGTAGSEREDGKNESSSNPAVRRRGACDLECGGREGQGRLWEGGGAKSPKPCGVIKSSALPGLSVQCKSTVVV